MSIGEVEHHEIFYFGNRGIDMRLIIQRVKKASVTVSGELKGSCEAGYLVLVGVGQQDSKKDVSYCVEKTKGLRVFEDERGKMNLSIVDIGGEVLAVSQFTLYGDVRKGKRPSFTASATPTAAKELYEMYVEELKRVGIPTQTGVFGADMQVELVNDGPVTIMIDSEKLF